MQKQRSLRDLYKQAQARKRDRTDVATESAADKPKQSVDKSKKSTVDKSKKSSVDKSKKSTDKSADQSADKAADKSKQSGSSSLAGRLALARPLATSETTRPPKSVKKSPIETERPVKQARSSRTAAAGRESLEQMQQRLAASQFRWLNEQLYTTDSRKARQLFSDDPELFSVYHEGFRDQVEQWPVHPLDRIIEAILKLPAPAGGGPLRVGDIGCGEARLARTLTATDKLSQRYAVHSFDLVALNERVTVADMAALPLPAGSLDVAVFCLALMGTNIDDFLREACRTLVPGGLLYIAEVQSRFEQCGVPGFVAGVEAVGFQLQASRELTAVFILFTFTKKAAPAATAGKRKAQRRIQLKPCLYKKR